MAKDVRRKATAVAIIILMLLGALLIGIPLAKADTQSGDYHYDLVNGNAYITGYSGAIKDVVIPSTIDGHNVVALGNRALAFKNITSVTIPDSVTLIGNNSFAQCTALTSVSLGAGVVYLEDGVFAYCLSLTTVSIPDSVTFIGNDTFYLCNSLTSINVGNANPSFKSVDGVLFDKPFSTLIKYPGAKTGAYVIPPQIMNVRSGAFFGCIGLTTVAITDDLLRLGDHPFAQCRSLVQIKVGDGNNFYSSSDGVLYDKAGDSLITYPGGKGGPFSVPDPVKTIMNYSFSMSLISSVSMGSNVRTIADNAFMYCPNLTSVSMGYGGPRIGERAFYYCQNLTSVTIGSNVLMIGDDAFALCLSLTSITIPNKVKSIGEGAFRYCLSLSSVVIGSGVTTIMGSAFSQCISLKSMTIPKSVTNIDFMAFSSCTSLMVFNVATDNLDFASLDGVLYDEGLKRLVAFPGGRTGTFDVPDSVEAIKFGAFYGSNITAVNMGDGVIAIENYAFCDCRNLTSVTMGGNIADVGYNSFARCGSLSFIVLSSGLKTIEEAAFEECTNLSSIIIPAGVTTIGHAAFYGCSNLTSIYFLGLGAPTSVDFNWIAYTGTGLLGHAYAASNFPTPGNKFNDLLMGEVIPVVPGEPSALEATAHNGSAVLRWAIPAIDGGSAITGYRVFRATDLNGNYMLVGSANMTSYNDTSLEGGHNYWYRVAAINSNGEGAPSLAVGVDIPQSPSSGNDIVLPLILVVIAAIVIVAVAALLVRRRKG